MTKYRFTFSSEDGDQTKDFDNLRDAESYMNDFIEGVERWSQTTFWPYDSHTSYRLFKDRKGRVIKIDKIESQKIKRKYFNFENQKTIDILSFNQETLEKIRLERECMEKDIEGSIMSSEEINHYLSEGFTITTYQADYVLEGHEFCYD